MRISVNLCLPHFRNAFQQLLRGTGAILLGLLVGAQVPPAQTGLIAVSGETLLRDGNPWTAKGVELDAVISPQGYETSPKYVAARAHFGPTELSAIKSFGADTIRICVSQAGLDPRSSIYSLSYLQEIIQTVETTRRWGFTVILCMQAGRAAGIPGLSRVPDDSTVRAWQTLAPRFGNDLGVLYNLFNEPQNAPRNPWAWRTWQKQQQSLVNIIRDVGAQNVLIAEGIAGGRTLAGALPLADSLGKIVYGIHPYFYASDNITSAQSLWNIRFGDFAKTHPVIVTEWQTASTTRQCRSASPEIAYSFLSYLQTHHIGLSVWAWDIVPIVIRDWSFDLTNFIHFECGQRHDGGPGRMLHLYYKFGIIEPPPSQ